MLNRPCIQASPLYARLERERSRFGTGQDALPAGLDGVGDHRRFFTDELARALKGHRVALRKDHFGGYEGQNGVVRHRQIPVELVRLAVRTRTENHILPRRNRPVSLGNDRHLNGLPVLTTVQHHANARTFEGDIHQRTAADKRQRERPVGVAHQVKAVNGNVGLHGLTREVCKCHIGFDEPIRGGGADGRVGRGTVVECAIAESVG